VVDTPKEILNIDINNAFDTLREKILIEIPDCIVAAFPFTESIGRFQENGIEGESPSCFENNQREA